MTGFFCRNLVIYFFITWFPIYLVQGLFTQRAWHNWHPAGPLRNSFRMVSVVMSLIRSIEAAGGSPGLAKHALSADC